MSAPMNSSESKSPSLFYGWYIVAVSTLALVVTNGLTIGGLPIFYEPLGNDLIARGALTKETSAALFGLAPAITFLVAGLFSPVAGALLKRFDIKILMTIGCVILGAALLFYSQATIPTHVYIAHAGFGFALAFAGVLVNTVLVSNWFRKQRGKAVGITITGTSIGGVLIPTLAVPLINNFGWRTGIVVLSLLVWFILLPAIWLIVKVSPAKIGLKPDGDAPNFDFDFRPPDAAEKNSELLAEVARNPLLTEDKLPPSEIQNPPSETGLTLWQALKTPLFWVLGLCAALIFYPIFATSQQFILYLQRDLKFSTETAAIVQSLIFVASVGGKFGFGWLADKFPVSRVLLVCCGLMFLGTLFLLNLNQTTAFLFLLPFGLGYGGTFVLLQLITAESFGLRDIGRILGVIIVIETVGGAVGNIITGQAAKAAGGNYAVAFNGVVWATALAFVMSILVNLLSRRKTVA